ncbi:hypothetical protein ACIQ8D_15225 [Streptomyces sp. NPDC096094]|uniref:hypothetical protein n=1 Tax=Streptomyces sp. NPDC096094 TaxID=3366073 RepID=UPI0038224005
MTDTSTEQRDPLDIARDAIPGFRAVQTADRTVQQRLAELRAAPTVQPVNLGTEAFEAVTTGKPIPEDLGRRAVEAQRADEYRTAELQILMGVEKRLQNHGDNTLRDGADHGLRALRPVLDELLDQARPMAAALNGVHDAQGAIDRGPDAVAAWSGFAAIVTRYAGIRSAQRKLSQYVIGESVGTPFGSVGFRGIFDVWSEIENLTEVWPEWAPGQKGERIVRPPWPVEYPHKPFEVQHDREWVLWLLSDPKVRLWVPTVGELTDAYVAQRRDAGEQEGKAPAKRRTHETLKRPVRYRGSDGGEWAEYQEV